MNSTAAASKRSRPLSSFITDKPHAPLNKHNKANSDLEERILDMCKRKLTFAQACAEIQSFEDTQLSALVQTANSISVPGNPKPNERTDLQDHTDDGEEEPEMPADERQKKIQEIMTKNLQLTQLNPELTTKQMYAFKTTNQYP